MKQSGEFGVESGTQSKSKEVVEERSEGMPMQLTLRSIVLDVSLLHGICLEAFKIHSQANDTLSTQLELKSALSHISSRTGLDDFEDEDVEDLWVSALNFAEFFLLARELFTSLHRSVSVDFESESSSFL